MNYETLIKFGNAITPYRVIVAEQFNTEFAANLYGSLECTERCKESQYHYWTVKHSPASGDSSGHLA